MVIASGVGVSSGGKVWGALLAWLLYLWGLLVAFLRRICKPFMRKVTRLCELQRVVYGELRGCRRIRKVEDSLRRSKNPDVKSVLEELEKAVTDGRMESRGSRRAMVTNCAARIAKAKGINMKLHSKFIVGLMECLEVITAYQCLKVKVLQLRATPYSLDDPEHEDKLIQLWNASFPNEPLSGRRSKQWQDLGFQGNDPATDFRGAGVLALETICFFAGYQKDVFGKLIKSSHHPLYSYPLSLLMIQMTYLGSELVRWDTAKSHFYNRAGIILQLDDSASPNDAQMWGKELLKTFYEFCAALTIDFDALWVSSKPKDIMQFASVRSKFDIIIVKKLKQDDACFLLEPWPSSSSCDVSNLEFEEGGSVALVGFRRVPPSPRPSDSYHSWYSREFFEC